MHPTSTLLTTLLAALPAVRGSTQPTVASAWYASFHADDFPLSAVSWDKYTHMMYSFAETAPNVDALASVNGSQLDALTFTAAAHQNGVKALATVGGWTGSRFFSTDMGSPSNRTAFVQTVVNFAKDNNFDGLDFDWESPGSQGIGCNTISPDDTSNFLTFLQELRADPVGATLILTAATGLLPWVDASGSPVTDVSGFAAVFDHINIMNYDVWGPWSSGAGPNSPLQDACAPANDQVGSAAEAVAAWTAAGMPASKIVLGVPAYGHSFRVQPQDAFVSGTTTLAAYPPFNASDTPVGDKWDDQPGVDECGNEQSQGGLFDFWGLIDGGFLTSSGDPAPGISYLFDNCTETPYVYNATSKVMVAYDNAQSFAAKGDFIKTQGLLGFAMWEAGGDSNDILLDSIRGASGMN